MPKNNKNLLQCHNNLINKQTNKPSLSAISIFGVNKNKEARGRGVENKVIAHRLGVFFHEFLWVTVKADVRPALSPPAGWWSSQR